MRRDYGLHRVAASFALAVLLILLTCLLVPRAWVVWWLQPYRGRGDGQRRVAPLVISAEPRIVPDFAPAATDSAAPPNRAALETPPAAAPGWWDAAWDDWIAERARDLRPSAPVPPPDFTLLASRLVAAIPDSLWRRARVDTSRAARLAAARDFFASDLRRSLPALQGAMATRKAVDILNREAELFGEYLLMR